jgi:parallel beta-helix repeat protein
MYTRRAPYFWPSCAVLGLFAGACGDAGTDSDLPGHALAESDLTTGFVNVKPAHSNKCVEVAGSSTSDGAQIRQWSCGSGTNQQWQFVGLGVNNYRIVVRHSGKCLDVSGRSTADGARVHQWACHGGTNQQWTVVDTGGGRHEVRAVNSGKCLDVSGASTADGGQLIQWACHGGANQRYLLSVPPGGTGGTGGTSGAGGSGGSGAAAGSAGSAGTGGSGGSAGGGTTHYVDPASGSTSGDGSAQRPWRTVQEVVQAGHFGTRIRAGDTVLLRTGYHGELLLDGGSYAAPITIAAEAGHTPRLRRVQAARTSGFVLRGLSISPSHAPAYARLTIVDIQSSATNVTVDNCDIFSVGNASAWTANEWVNTASSGVQVSGAGVTVKNSRIRNVRFGVSATGQNALIERNTIDGFSADGLRGLGNFETFQYNVVKNAYADDSVDSNHDDGFQSWSVGPGGVGTGEVRGIVLRGNTFINFENPSQPLKATLQGVGCFDGLFVDWVVENNVVITNHWHGISLYGARNSRIVNNTVIDNDSASPGPPWIMVNAHKDGRPSENVVVRNNLATDYSLQGTNVTNDHNTELANNLAAYFVNPAAFDLHLRAGSPAIDAGIGTLAPSTDRDGVGRPQGAGFDLGAFEFR